MSINVEKRAISRSELTNGLGSEIRDFSGRDFTGTDLSSLNLSNLTFRDCDFRGANFSNADLAGVDFSGSDLNNAKGLSEAKNLATAKFINTLIDESNRLLIQRAISRSMRTVILPRFETAPYGAKLQLDGHTSLLILAPKTDTAAGKDQTELIDGMRSHPNTKSEHVTFLRYADDAGQSGGNEKPLRYKFKDEHRKTECKRFGPGDEFYSVFASGIVGYFHVLENTSKRPIMLLIRVEKEEVSGPTQVQL